MKNESRRAFLGSVAVAAPVLVASGGLATGWDSSKAEAAGSEPRRPDDGGRRVVRGSPNRAFSRAVILDRLVYVSGVVGRKSGTSEPMSREFEPQCRQALENLKASVEAAGSQMAQVLKCSCFLTDVADFPVMNKLFQSFFPVDPPARSTVVVKELVVPGAKLEIDCVTALA